MTLYQATIRGLEKGHKIARKGWAEGNYIYAAYGLQLKARSAGGYWHKTKTGNWAPAIYEVTAKDWIIIKDE